MVQREVAERLRKSCSLPEVKEQVGRAAAGRMRDKGPELSLLSLIQEEEDPSPPLLLLTLSPPPIKSNWEGKEGTEASFFAAAPDPGGTEPAAAFSRAEASGKGGGQPIIIQGGGGSIMPAVGGKNMGGIICMGWPLGPGIVNIIGGKENIGAQPGGGNIATVWRSGGF